MEVEGSIKVVFDMQSYASGFTKKEFVVTTKEQYPQDIKLELIKDRTDLIDPYKVGDNVKVHFNLRGNEYNGKYFVNLQAWRIEPLSSGVPETDEGSSLDAGGFPEEPMVSGGAEEDDLPF